MTAGIEALANFLRERYGLAASFEPADFAAVAGILDRRDGGRPQLRRYLVYTERYHHPSELRAHSWQDAYEQAKQEHGSQLVSVQAAPPRV